MQLKQQLKENPSDYIDTGYNIKLTNLIYDDDF
jgi:hypothetical protein